MKENLIYGKTVFEFGDAGEDAGTKLERAFESDEKYIVIPFGTYRTAKQVLLKDGVTVVCHPRARIECAGVKNAEGAAHITVFGGIWTSEGTEDGVFEFENTSDITLEDVTVEADGDMGIALCDVSCAALKNVRVTAKADAMERPGGIILAGNDRGIRIESLFCGNCAACIEWISGALTENVSVRGIEEKNCESVLLAADAAWKNVRVEDVRAGASANAVDLTDCSFTDVTLDGFALYDGFAVLAGNVYDNVKLAHFTRLASEDIHPERPTLAVAGSDVSVELFGVTLDAVILSKKSVPDVKMDAKRLASYLADPTAFRYICTFALTSQNTFVLPIGGYESVVLTKRKD